MPQLRAKINAHVLYITGHVIISSSVDTSTGSVRIQLVHLLLKDTAPYAPVLMYEKKAAPIKRSC